jgi:predicted lipoprotein with Yx(FWY)xxD motif
MSRALTLLAACGAFAIAGCGDDSGSSDSSEPTASAATATEGEKSPAASPAAGTKIQVASSDYGSILFDGSDQAIYLFDKESGPTSECYDACAEAWPPVVTKADPAAGAGAKAALLGTTERDDGTTQVTYKGHPLYYYVDDPKGDVLCHDVAEFGGTWLVVDAAGDAV